MGHGGSRRRDLSWWRRHGRTRSLNPRSIRTAGIHSEAHVQRYMRNPSPLFGGADTPVCVVKLDGLLGGYFAREGAHRIEAARRTGRRVRCLVVTEAQEQGR